MKAHIKIPRGWRRLREGEEIIGTDRFLNPCNPRWEHREGTTDNGDYYVAKYHRLTIRKIKARKGGKAK